MSEVESAVCPKRRRLSTRSFRYRPNDLCGRVLIKSAAMEFQSEGYYHIVQEKTAQVEALLSVGLHVLFSDSDVYFLQDPLQTALPCRSDECHIAMSTNRPDTRIDWNQGDWNLVRQSVLPIDV